MRKETSLPRVGTATLLPRVKALNSAGAGDRAAVAKEIQDDGALDLRIGTEGVRRALCDWLDWIGMIDAGTLARLDRFISWRRRCEAGGVVTAREWIDPGISVVVQVRQEAWGLLLAIAMNSGGGGASGGAGAGHGSWLMAQL